MHFLPLLKISLLLNYNNFQMLALFSVPTSESVMSYFVNTDFVTWGGFCGVKIVLIIMQMYIKAEKKKGNSPQLLYITLGFAVLICSSNYSVRCEPCFSRDKAWKQLQYMNNSSDYDVSGNLKCCLSFFKVRNSLGFCIPAWMCNRQKNSLCILENDGIA